jgi:hypothetical protein
MLSHAAGFTRHRKSALPHGTNRNQGDPVLRNQRQGPRQLLQHLVAKQKRQSGEMHQSVVVWDRWGDWQSAFLGSEAPDSPTVTRKVRQPYAGRFSPGRCNAGRQGLLKDRAIRCVTLFEEPVGVGISRFMNMSCGESKVLLPAGARGAGETGGPWSTQTPPTRRMSHLCGSAGLPASWGFTPHEKSAEAPYFRWRPAHEIEPQPALSHVEHQRGTSAMK